MRWVYLEDVERKQGVQIAYVGGEDDAGAQMSAMPFAAEMLESAGHDYELEVGKNGEQPVHTCPAQLSYIPGPDLPKCTDILYLKTCLTGVRVPARPSRSPTHGSRWGRQLDALW